MKFLLLFLCLSANASLWQTNLVVYWFNNTQPAVAVTASNIVSIEHVTGSVTSVQIGDSAGIIPGLCTGLITDGDCAVLINDCQWGRRYKNETNDVFLFRTCRPVTSGIAYVFTNAVVTTPIVWYSIARHVWFTGTITHVEPIVLETFANGDLAYYGQYSIDGTLAIGGDSGSPMFNVDGDFMGCIAGTSGGSLPNFVYFLFPTNVTTRPVTPVVIPNLGSSISALFNSDPDR